MAKERLDLNKTLVMLAAEGWTGEDLLTALQVRMIENLTTKQEEVRRPTLQKEKEQKWSLDQKISEIFRDLGVTTNILGYRYLRDAIELTISNKNMLNYMTKTLYPTVAKKYETTASKVERAIRVAIESAWKRGNPELIEKYFGYTISADRGKPTNSEFITTIAEYLRLEGYGVE